MNLKKNIIFFNLVSLALLASCARPPDVERHYKTLKPVTPVENVEDNIPQEEPEIVIFEEDTPPPGAIFMKNKDRKNEIVLKTGVVFKNTKASFKDASRELLVMSDFYLKDNKDVKKSFVIKGIVTDVGYANLFPKKEDEIFDKNDKEQITVRGRATCLDRVSKSEKFKCHNIIIDIFIRKNGKYYTHQVEYKVTKKKPVKPVDSPEAPPAPEKDKEKEKAKPPQDNQEKPPVIITPDKGEDPTDIANNEDPDSEEEDQGEDYAIEYSRPGAYIAGTNVDLADLYEKDEDSKDDPTPAIIKEAATRRPVEQAEGASNNGKINNATNMINYKGELFSVLHPERKFYFATFDLMEAVSQAATVTKDLVPDYKLQVSDCSLERGGRGIKVQSRYQNGHKSHQNGLDADIAYIVKRPLNRKFSVVSGSRLTSEFLLEENWELIKSILKNPITNVVFVGPVIKKKFCDLAKSEGAESLRLTKKLAPLTGHDDHFHWRILCTKYNRLCRDVIVTRNTGCQ